MNVELSHSFAGFFFFILRKEGKNMDTAERRHSIMQTLYRRRYDTISNLSEEYGISKRTMRRDIDALSLTAPIYTQSGRNGGVYVLDGCYGNHINLSEEETKVLYKLYGSAQKQQACPLTKTELTVFEKLLTNYTQQ